MKYNKKYNRWVTTGGLVYRYNTKLDRLVLCKPHINKKGYVSISVNSDDTYTISLHRLVYETFKGVIPTNLEVDHIDDNPTNNCISNLQLLSHADNNRKRKFKSKGNGKKYLSEFGKLFYDTYKLTAKDNMKLYLLERYYFNKYGRLRGW